MNEKNFQLFLEEKNISKDTINNILSKLRAYEEYLLNENLNSDTVRAYFT